MLSDAEYRAVVEFLYREARLADEARYAEWLALWTDDGVYWVPATTDPGADPDKHISHIYDNRGPPRDADQAAYRPATATARSRRR